MRLFSIKNLSMFRGTSAPYRHHLWSFPKFSIRIKVERKQLQLMIHSAHLHSCDVIHGYELLYGDAGKLTTYARLRLLPPSLPLGLFRFHLRLSCPSFLVIEKVEFFIIALDWNASEINARSQNRKMDKIMNALFAKDEEYLHMSDS